MNNQFKDTSVNNNMDGNGNKELNTSKVALASDLKETKEQKERLVKPLVIVDSKKATIKIDVNNVTYEAIKDMTRSDKGNVTVTYETFKIGNVNYQLTGYVKKSEIEEMEEMAHLEAIKEEARKATNEKLLMQQQLARQEAEMAQMRELLQQLMNK
jgi:hypothetical protein